MLICEEAVDNESCSTLLVQWHNSFEKKKNWHYLITLNIHNLVFNYI